MNINKILISTTLLYIHILTLICILYFYICKLLTMFIKYLNFWFLILLGPSHCKNAFIIILMLTLSCGTNLHAHAMQSSAASSYGTVVPLAGMHQLYLHLKLKVQNLSPKLKSNFLACRYLELHSFWMQRKRVSFP